MASSSSRHTRPPRRRAGPPAARVPTSVPSPRTPTWRDWANLDKELTACMAAHVLADDVLGYVQFRDVCVSWREHTQDPRLRSVLESRFHPRRWIMLPDPVDDEGLRRLVNVDMGRTITTDLPDLVGHHVAPGSGGSPDGVLVMVEDRSLAVRLLNPLTRQVVDLPSIAPVLSRRRRGGMDTDFLDLCKVTGAGFVGESTVVLHLGMDNKLVSTRLGDDEGAAAAWQVICNASVSCAVFHFAGNVYVAKIQQGLMVVDATASPPRLVLAAAWPHKEWALAQMAECSGVLLVLCIKVQRKAGKDYKAAHEVYRLDPAAGMLLPVVDLGERALFAGEYSGGLVVSLSGDGVDGLNTDVLAPNSICFKHDHQFGRFFVRQISDGKTRLLLGVPKDSFVDNLTAYVAWRGRKELRTD